MKHWLALNGDFSEKNGKIVFHGVLQIKVKHQNEKSPAKFARPKKGATNQTGEKVPHRPR